VVEGVGSGLAVVEMGWRDPFGGAVFAFSGFTDGEIPARTAVRVRAGKGTDSKPRLQRGPQVTCG
jgi:hypothetical protein